MFSLVLFGAAIAPRSLGYCIKVGYLYQSRNRGSCVVGALYWYHDLVFWSFGDWGCWVPSIPFFFNYCCWLYWWVNFFVARRNCMGQHGWYSFFFGLYYTVIGPAYAEAYLLGLLLLCLDPTRFPLRDSTHLLPWFNSDYCSFIFQLNLGDSWIVSILKNTRVPPMNGELASNLGFKVRGIIPLLAFGWSWIYQSLRPLLILIMIMLMFLLPCFYSNCIYCCEPCSRNHTGIMLS